MRPFNFAPHVALSFFLQAKLHLRAIAQGHDQTAYLNAYRWKETVLARNPTRLHLAGPLLGAL